MIEKLDIKNGGVEDLLNCIKKINELVDAVNELQKQIDKMSFAILDLATPNGENKALESIKAESKTSADPYAEQRQWIGCVCRFWYDNPNDTLLDYLEKIQTGKNGVEYYAKESGDWFPNCKPVLPTDNAIYKGGDNE